MPLINFEKYNVLMDKSYTSQLGKVAKVVGLTIESIGPSAKLNDLCLIRSNNRTEPVKAEVVGFRDDRVLLMPYDDVEGVGLGSWVENTGAPLQVAVGEELLAIMYRRNLDEGDEAVIGLDGGLFPPGMFCNEVDDGENDTKADLQGEWLEDYLDALEEMEE